MGDHPLSLENGNEDLANRHELTYIYKVFVAMGFPWWTRSMRVIASFILYYKTNASYEMLVERKMARAHAWIYSKLNVLRPRINHLDIIKAESTKPNGHEKNIMPIRPIATKHIVHPSHIKSQLSYHLEFDNNIPLHPFGPNRNPTCIFGQDSWIHEASASRVFQLQNCKVTSNMVAFTLGFMALTQNWS